MITANLFFNRTPNWDAWRLSTIVPQLAKRKIPEQGISESSLKAYINHGTWLVKCECGGCEKVWEEGLMMCMSCLNAKYGHKYRRTTFPKQRKEIEILLINRPLPNRNWYPGETLAFLKVENEAHKAELLGG